MGKAARQANREFRAAKDMVSRAVTAERAVQWFSETAARSDDREFRRLFTLTTRKWLVDSPRIVFDMDPDLFEALKSTKCEEVPFSVFRHLPYESFVVAGITVPLARGPVKGSVLVNMEDWEDGPEGLGLMVSLLADERNDDGSHSTSHLSLDGLVRTTGMLAPVMPHKRLEPRDSKEDDEMEVYTSEDEFVYSEDLAMIIAILMYLASPDPDIEGVTPEKYRRTEERRGTGTLPDTYRAGWHVGAALRRAQEADREEYEATGRRVRPHLRKAHWHLYWTGTDRSVPRMRWVAPVAVNKDLGDPVKTVRPVSG